MISTRKVPVALATSRRGAILTQHCCCHLQQQAQTAAGVAASQRRRESTAKSSAEAREEPHDELLQLEEEYATLKVNWFPGHMVKATKIIREKLKQVDMVFEVRDARIPFTSANDDLDKIVGPSKARLIVLNKADLSNQALEQRVLQRFREQGKTAVYACGRTGTNVNKLLAWARERGARRGEFATTGAVAMVVGMPNVGKSSLINLLRGKANSRGRGAGGGGGGGGEGAKQVARVGAMPGVTRQVSAFRIASTPPLYLVDTPGVMVPRVDRVTAGLCLALTRAVPDAVVPPDILVRFMLRVVRSRRLFGAQKSRRAPPPPPPSPSASRSTPGAGGRRPRQQQQQPRRSKAIAAWLSSLDAREAKPTTGASKSAVGRRDSGGGAVAGEDEKGDLELASITRCSSDGGGGGGGGFGGDNEEAITTAEAKRRQQEKEDDEEEEDMEALLESVERESGAEGKPAPEARRICCRFLLDAFRDGQFGRITLDSVPRSRRAREAPEPSSSSSSEESRAGWAEGLAVEPGERVRTGSGSRSRSGGDSGRSPSGRSARGARGGRDRHRPSSPPAVDGALAERLVRDWSSPDSWERAGTGGR